MQSGDTWELLAHIYASAYNLTSDDLQAANAAVALTPGSLLVVPCMANKQSEVRGLLKGQQGKRKHGNQDMDIIPGLDDKIEYTDKGKQPNLSMEAPDK